MDIQEVVSVYKRRFQVNVPILEPSLDKGTSLIIAIPSYKEPDILTTLRSLAACDHPKGTVEVLITVNAPDNADDTILGVNRTTIEQIEAFQYECPGYMKVRYLDVTLPKKHAGAGLARKIGMDEAVQRWASIGVDGAIVCLDADCEVSPNYLVEGEKAFQDQSTKVAHFHFDHRYALEENPELREGIMNYELHLRYYIQGLKYAGFKLAVHTVGSSMACRASTYAKTGGMNKRRAGEDFYFLHKLVPHGGWKDIVNATVFPSCRVSDRVPFGTGRAQMEWVEDQSTGWTYHPEVYEVMKPLFGNYQKWFESGVNTEGFNPVLVSFLEEQNVRGKLEEINKQSSSLMTFDKRFWQWMDGFMVMKMTHYIRDNGYPNQSVFNAANTLLTEQKIANGEDLEETLSIYRELDTKE